MKELERPKEDAKFKVEQELQTLKDAVKEYFDFMDGETESFTYDLPKLKELIK